MIKKLLFVKSFIFVLFAVNDINSVMQCDTSKSLLGGIDVTCTTANCPNDSIVTIFENGILRRKFIYMECKDKGEFIYFADNGDTLSKSYFFGEKTVGIEKQWHGNRKVESICQYNDKGQKHGLSQTWREDGTRKDSVVYENDTIIEMREYFFNGKIRHWFKQCRGTNTTEAYFYHADGNSAGKVKGGNGTVISYTESAERRFSDRYENGIMVESKEVK